MEYIDVPALDPGFLSSKSRIPIALNRQRIITKSVNSIGGPSFDGEEMTTTQELVKTDETSLSQDILNILPLVRDAAKLVVLPNSPEGASFATLLKCPLSCLYLSAEALEEACGTAPLDRRLSREPRNNMLAAFDSIVALDALLDPTILREDADGEAIWTNWMDYDQVVDKLREILSRGMKFDVGYMTCCKKVDFHGLRKLRECTVTERKPHQAPAFIQSKKPISFTEPPAALARGRAALRKRFH
jgi:hypothetical protein